MSKTLTDEQIKEIRQFVERAKYREEIGGTDDDAIFLAWATRTLATIDQLQPDAGGQEPVAKGRAETLINEIADVFGIGSAARSRMTILTNASNARRRSDILGRIESEFFTVEIPEDQIEPEDSGIEFLLNWGEEPDAYIETFRKALAQLYPKPPSAIMGAPDEWLIVPKVPTETMIVHAHQICDGTHAGDVYKAMLAAAPQPSHESANTYNEDAERELFERDQLARMHYLARDVDGDYADGMVNDFWFGWKCKAEAIANGTYKRFASLQTGKGNG